MSVAPISPAVAAPQPGPAAGIAFALGAVWVGPLDGDAVGGVFAGEAEEVGEAVRADVFEADEAYARFGGGELTRYREDWLP